MLYDLLKIQVVHPATVRIILQKIRKKHDKVLAKEDHCLPEVPATGQPTHESHPHLLKPGELMVAIKVDEFKERRRKFMNLLNTDSLARSGMHKHHLVIIPSATKIYMSENIPYVFRQNSNFLYLTGCLEPDTMLVMSGSETEFTSTLFVGRQDSKSELWDGPKTGVDVAPTLFGVDDARFLDTFPSYLETMSRQYPNHLLHYDLESSTQSKINKIVENYVKNQKFVIHSPTKYADRLRLTKSSAERSLMRTSCDIASEAIVCAMRATRPSVDEHRLYAVVDYECRVRGAQRLAYPPVVASGRNATIIHYINNDQMLQDGDLVLMDAGCEYHGYCSDITRTFPVNGRFSNYQRILYEIVLTVQKQLIDFCNERRSLDTIYRTMISLFGRHLQQENVIRKEALNSRDLFDIVCELCPHHSSHYLGMDVHDVKSISKGIPLTDGMVFTVEPGLYIRENNPDVAPEFWNTGIRIEDDVLITNTGVEVLSSCPKEVDDVQKIMTDAR